LKESWNPPLFDQSEKALQRTFVTSPISTILRKQRKDIFGNVDVLNDFDFNIKFSEMGSSDKEEIDSDVDTVLADIAKWSDPLRPIKSLNLPRNFHFHDHHHQNHSNFRHCLQIFMNETCVVKSM
jgi:hypothetical protein